MPESPTPTQAESLSMRQVVAWTAFAAVLLAGILLWFRFRDRIIPMLDVLTDR